MRQGVDMTTSHRNRTVLNHDSATDGSPHDEHDAEARRSGGTGDISPCGAHADAVGAVLARQALEDAPAGVIGTLARDRGVLVRGRGVTALGSPFRGPSPSARRRRSRICGATSIGIGVASGRLGADARVPGDRSPAGAGGDRALRRLGRPGGGGARRGAGVRPDASDRRRRIVASTAESAGCPPWRRWRGRCACAFDRSIPRSGEDVHLARGGRHGVRSGDLGCARRRRRIMTDGADVTELRDLPGVGPELEAALRAAGITDAETLRRTGSVEAWWAVLRASRASTRCSLWRRRSVASPSGSSTTSPASGSDGRRARAEP